MLGSQVAMWHTLVCLSRPQLFSQEYPQLFSDVQFTGRTLKFIPPSDYVGIPMSLRFQVAFNPRSDPTVRDVPVIQGSGDSIEVIPLHPPNVQRDLRPHLRDLDPHFSSPLQPNARRACSARTPAPWYPHCQFHQLTPRLCQCKSGAVC